LSPDRPSRYPREPERIHIVDRLREKASIRQIAAELGRSPSTISREIPRDGMPLREGTSRWAYRPHAAQSRADARRPTRDARPPAASPEAGKDRPEPRTARLRPGPPRAPLESGTGLPGFAGTLPRPDGTNHVFSVGFGGQSAIGDASRATDAM
jgi:hypothetical protein